MVKFLDGPAAGELLGLRRAPTMLRVVRSAAGEWDALDQLEDEPKPGELIHVYRIRGTPTRMFFDYRDKAGRRRGEMSMMADYRYLPDQPGDEHTRTTDAWRTWCEAYKARLLAERAAAEGCE